MSPKVLASLDRTRRYGLWHYGKDRVTMRTTGTGRRFKRTRAEDRIAVPIPDAGIPREWVDATRRYFETYRGWRDKPGSRFYELRGFVLCGACGGTMTSCHSSGYYYYSCTKRRNHGGKACPNSVNINASKLEDKVMRDVSLLLQVERRIVRQLGKAIERETAATRSPHDEVAVWAWQIEDCERKRAKYLEMYADDLVSRDELDSKLRELKIKKATAEQHLSEARDGESRIQALKATKEKMVRAYATGILYDGIEYFSPQMRHEIYGALELKVTAHKVAGQKSGGRIELDYGDVDANVIRLTREVEDYAAEAERYRLNVSRPKTDVSMVVLK